MQRGFFWLWLGFLISSIGNHLHVIAFSVLVLDKTDSVFHVGVILATHFIPMMIGSIIAGPFVDRLSARRIMIAADLSRGGLLVGFVVWDHFHPTGLWEIGVVAALNGFAQAWFGPASQSILRRVVETSAFVKANAYYQMTGQTTEIVTKAASGFALLTMGPIGLLLLDGLSFFCSALCTFVIRIQESSARRKFSYFDDLKAGWLYLQNAPEIRFTLLAFCAMNFLAIPSFVLMIPFFKKEAGLGMELYGFFMSMMAVGMIIGGSVCARIHQKWHYTLMATSTVVINGLFMLVSWAQGKEILAIGLGVGFCMGCGRILSQTLVLANTSQDYVGRMFGLLGFCSGFLTPIGMLISGYLGEHYAIRDILRFSYALAIALTVLIVLHPTFRRAFKPQPETPRPADRV